MNQIDQIYIDGAFVRPHGSETMTLVNPVTEQPASIVTLADEEDARTAIAAARRAYATYRHSTLAERADHLTRLQEAVRARKDELTEVMITEYGGSQLMCRGTVKRAHEYFAQAKQVMEEFAFERTIGRARVRMESLGVVGMITPWNASYGFICSKLSMALAVGSTAVIKPSELSARQTQILTECLHAAQLPPGLFNIVTGRGDVVGAAIVNSPDIAKITFTGSTAVGKSIARDAAATLKRVTLELGGKSPNVVLDDADFATALPLALQLAYMNNGQACIAGTRLLVPRSRLDEAKRILAASAPRMAVGDPAVATTQIGPMATAKQYERVQGYIRLAREEGAQVLTGGEGRPAGLERGYFTQPTVLVDVTNDMRVAREEIFGPVLSVIAYDSEDDAVRIANDTSYGLQAYVSGSPERARRVADQIVAGRVYVNGLFDEPLAPFGGFKQSGLGREFGSFGLEAYVEPKAVMG